MYPETDIPPVQITSERMNEIRSNLPEMPEKRLQRLQKEYKLNEKLAKQVLNSEYSELFETIVKESKVSSTTVAAFMTETLIALRREGIALEKVLDDDLRAMFRLMGEGKIAKEATTEVVSWLSKHEDKTMLDAVKELGIQSIRKDELNKLITRIVEENKKIIKERGEDSFGALMGIAMSTLRGKADAALISRILREKVKEAME